MPICLCINHANRIVSGRKGTRPGSPTGVLRNLQFPLTEAGAKEVYRSACSLSRRIGAAEHNLVGNSLGARGPPFGVRVGMVPAKYPATSCNPMKRHSETSGTPGGE